MIHRHWMRAFFSAAITLAATQSAIICDAQETAVATTWPQWRGADQQGVAPGDRYPIRWSEGSGLAWSVEIPGKGSSTPVIADGTTYLTSGIDGDNVLIAINTESGKIDWQTSLGPDRGNKHKKGGGSNPSPVIDGDSIYAYFRSGDLACVSTNGEVRWQTNLQDRYGEDTLWWDLGSSPMLTQNAVVLAVMQSGPSYLVAFDKQSGDVVWKHDRMLGAPKEAAQSYSTPIAVNVGGQEAIAVMGADHLTVHAAASGKTLGKLGGFNPTGHEFFRSISSPVASGSIAVCPYARGETLTAVDMDQLVAGKGQDSILWFRDDLGSDVPTPSIHDGRVYVVGDGKQSRGTVWCLDLKTGKTLWSVDLPKSRIGFSASPLVAGDHLYVAAEDATTYVIGPLSDSEPALVSTNQLGDDASYTVASPVPVGDELMIRTRHRLQRIAGQ